MAKTKITKVELSNIIERIMLEAENQAKFNGIEFIGLTEDEIIQKIKDKIGVNWEIVKE